MSKKVKKSQKNPKCQTHHKKKSLRCARSQMQSKAKQINAQQSNAK